MFLPQGRFVTRRCSTLGVGHFHVKSTTVSNCEVSESLAINHGQATGMCDSGLH